MRRRTVFWWVSILLLVPGSLRAQFEGMYESRNVTSGETGGLERFVMTVWIKNTRARIVTAAEGSGGSTTIIYRADRSVLWILEPAGKTFLEIPLQEEPTEAPAPAPASPYRVKRTKKSATIAGYLCEQVLIIRGEERTELWGTSRLQRLSKALEAALGTNSSSTAGSIGGEVDRLGLFPLKSTTTIGGSVVESQEVLRVVQQKVEETVFEIPPGYRKRDMNETLEEQSKGQK